MTYFAYNADGSYNNCIEIDPEQVTEYELLTGLTLALPPAPDAPDSSDSPDPAEMEAALNELGVQTRE